MITEKDLLDAIEECQHVANPNANTCIKLAAFYTIYKNMYGSQEENYSYAYAGDSEFARTIAGMDYDKVMSVMDEAMDTLSVLQPRLYAGIIRRLKAV